MYYILVYSVRIVFGSDIMRVTLEMR